MKRLSPEYVPIILGQTSFFRLDSNSSIVVFIDLPPYANTGNIHVNVNKLDELRRLSGYAHLRITTKGIGEDDNSGQENNQWFLVSRINTQDMESRIINTSSHLMVVRSLQAWADVMSSFVLEDLTLKNPYFKLRELLKDPFMLKWRVFDSI